MFERLVSLYSNLKDLRPTVVLPPGGSTDPPEASTQCWVKLYLHIKQGVFYSYLRWKIQKTSVLKFDLLVPTINIKSL